MVCILVRYIFHCAEIGTCNREMWSGRKTYITTKTGACIPDCNSRACSKLMRDVFFWKQQSNNTYVVLYTHFMGCIRHSVGVVQQKPTRLIRKSLVKATPATEKYIQNVSKELTHSALTGEPRINIKAEGKGKIKTYLLQLQLYLALKGCAQSVQTELGLQPTAWKK